MTASHLTNAMPVVVWSSDVFWDGLWYGAQHLASRLADRGFRVLFLEVPVSVASPLRDPARRKQIRSRLRRISSTLAVDVPMGLPPQDHPRMRAPNASIYARRVRVALRRLGWPAPSLVVGRHMSSGRLAPHFPDAHFVANLSDGLWYTGDADVAELKLRLAAADAAVCVSPGLERLAHDHGVPHTLLLSQGVDALAIAESVAAGLDPTVTAIEPPRIGLLGNMTPRTDFGLIERLAKARPDWHFVLVGAAGPRFPELADLPIDHLSNVHKLPPCERSDVGAVVAAFDVAWVPYTWAEFNVLSNPLKAWEYLAAGVPVVAPAFPALSPMAHVAALLDEGAPDDAWLEAIETAMAGDGSAATGRREFAQANTWDVRADELAAFLTDLL